VLVLVQLDLLLTVRWAFFMGIHSHLCDVSPTLSTFTHTLVMNQATAFEYFAEASTGEELLTVLDLVVEQFAVEVSEG
jgi:hypothetical protein